ncbi:MAG TPA: DUF192 domain-containing protein [Burkholderiaceae bacterium]|nr:DUF192 domain-containing protein [Burkholderiaceae bacterium]
MPAPVALPARAGRVRRLCRTLSRRAAAVAVAAASLAALAASAAAQPNPRLPQVTIQAGIHLIRAEVADTPATRAIGLMLRERLGPNEGMLFVFQHKAPQCFWMKNTLIPLSIAFIDDDGRIANIADMQPHSEDSHCSAKPVRFALEMDQGWFARRGIAAGNQLSSAGLFPAASTK